MTTEKHLLDQFIAAACRTGQVVVQTPAGLQVSPHVQQTIKIARQLLPLLTDTALKNQVARVLHDVYTDLRADIKLRGVEVNGQKHPALDPSLQAYRILIS